MKPDKTNKMVTNYSIPDMTRKYQNEEYVINMKKKRSYESFAEAGAMEKLNIDKKTESLDCVLRRTFIETHSFD